jgi:hypothetical protein
MCIHRFIHPFNHLIYSSFHPPIHLIYSSIQPSIHSFIHPSIHLFINPSFHSSIYPPIFSSIYSSMVLICNMCMCMYPLQLGSTVTPPILWVDSCACRCRSHKDGEYIATDLSSIWALIHLLVYLYVAVTSSQLLDCMARVKRSATNPGLYVTSPTLGLAKCVDAHVQALRDVDGWMDRWMDGWWLHVFSSRAASVLYLLCESPLLFLETNK